MARCEEMAYSPSSKQEGRCEPSARWCTPAEALPGHLADHGKTGGTCAISRSNSHTTL